MTACKDSLSGKKAVSATLAGVLAVGMVPAAAFAADADQPETGDIELQSVESVAAFNEATVAGTLTQNGATVTKPSYLENKAVTFTASTVTFKNGKSIDVSDTKVYGVSYYKADKDGKPTGDAISAPVNPGKYCAVVTAKSGLYEGGAASYAFTIEANQLGNVAPTALDKDGKPVQGGGSFTYDASNQVIGFTGGSKAELLKEGTDYTVKYYKAGGDLSDAYAIDGTPVDAGDYVAVLTGTGFYTGAKAAKVNVHVDQIDLSTATFDTIETTSSIAPTKPTAITVNGKKITDSALLDQIKLTLDQQASKTKYYDGNQAYTFTAAPADSANINFDKDANGKFKTGNVTVNKVKESATFKYGKAAFPESLDIDRSADQIFDATKIKAYTADGKTQITDGVSITYADKNGNTQKSDGSAYTAADVNAGGTWTVTVKVTPTYDTDKTAQTNYQVGGETTMTVKVTNGALNADAQAYVSFGNDVVTSIDTTYNGKDLLDTTGSWKSIGVVVKDADGTNLPSKDYKVTVTDADGKEVTEIKNAGTYKLAISSETYDLSGTTEVAINVAKIDLSTVKVNALKDYSGASYLPLKPAGKKISDQAYTWADLDLRYDTGKEAAKDDAADDAKGWDVLSTLPDGIQGDTYLVAEKYDEEKGEWVEVSWADGRCATEGVWRVTVKGTEALAKNYTFENEDNTTTTEFRVVDPTKLVFTDVTPTDWFFNEVAAANKAQYVYGIGNSKQFAPNIAITRADVAVILGRMAGVPTDPDAEGYDSFLGGYVTPFSDVDNSMYYAKAIAWAAKTGIVTGYGDGTFKPDQSITREEVATMLARYAQVVKGEDINIENVDEFLADYQDASSVSDWAKGYVAWAVEAGVMGQNTDFLWAGNNISRAETAAMAVRYQPSK